MLKSSCALRTTTTCSNFTIRLAVAFSIVAFSIFASLSTVASAQSGGQRYAPQPQPRQQPRQQGLQTAPAQGSAGQQGSANQLASSTAMDGYCAVCLVEKRAWNKGTLDFASNYDGRRYLFPGANQKAMFDANPSKYAPVLAGDDVVAYTQSGRRVPGVLANGISYKDRYYFFASPANKQAFQASPERFANADLALGGNCVVCQIDMNKKMLGNPAITSVHKGLRYQFPDAGAQQAFVSNPIRYTQAIGAPDASTRQPAPQGSGGGSGSY